MSDNYDETHDVKPRSRCSRTENGYPLVIEPTSVVVEDSSVDLAMLKALLPKLQYSTIVQAAKQIAGHSEEINTSLPDELPEVIPDELFQQLYRLLFDIHVLEGHLICPDTGRKFPIKDGVPNMILHEDEL